MKKSKNSTGCAWYSFTTTLTRGKYTMDEFIQQQLNYIEQAARQITAGIRGIFGYCNGMETVTKCHSTIPTPQLNQDNTNGYQKIILFKTLTEEIRKMMMELKIKGSVRERTNGLIELRTQALGSIYGRTKEEIEQKLTQRLKEVKKKTKQKEQFSVPTNFDKFAIYWFENFHKRKVAPRTYKKNIDTYIRNIQKEFANDKLAKISPIKIQNFLDCFSDKARTKETLHSILNQIFECAVKHGVIKLNPLGMVFYQKHERKHGKAISKTDEKCLLTTFADTPFQIDFAIALYTGLRPNEYATATIDGDFIKARNSKRKDGKIEYKRIPITPMLKPYITGIIDLSLHHPCTVSKKLKNVFPEYTLKDMRTTFQTRCTEYGVAEVAIGMFMGNGIGSELKKTYTDVSDEWLLKEGEKLNY